MVIRKATNSDLNAILEIIKMGKLLHLELGLPQWNLTSPSDEQIISDLDKFYVLEENNIIKGCMALTIGEDPDYKDIKGNWLITSSNYLTIHRLAVNNLYYHEGNASKMMEFAINFAQKNHLDSVRIDTHLDNTRMKGLIAKYNFKECGIVYIGGCLKRVGYELKLSY